jgi:ketosteroid isomerase-like protein
MQKTASPNKKVNDKAEIKKIIDGFMSALCQKDVKAMLSYYAADLIAFDVKPPFQVKGAVAWRHIWEACIGYFPSTFKTEIRDLTIRVSRDVAFAHYMFRLTGPEKDHAAMQTWLRITTGFKKDQSRWKIVHEHGSVPYHPHTLQAMFTLNL